MQRLQKFLASCGLGSRRSCEELILQGRVSVDGEFITKLGIQIDEEKQKVRCDGELLKAEKKLWFLFYKPRGVLCTNVSIEPKVIDYFRKISSRLFTVGRLDKESEGLILVTNDGDLSQKLCHPSYRIPKVYDVVVRGKITEKTIEKIRKGVWLSEGKITPSKIILLKSHKDSSTLRFLLKQGKNREIRRILAKIDHPVSRLIRIQFADFTLDNLTPGHYISIDRKRIEKTIQDAEKISPKSKTEKRSSKQQKPTVKSRRASKKKNNKNRRK